MVTLNAPFTSWISHLLACMGQLMIVRNFGLHINSCFQFKRNSIFGGVGLSSGCFGCCAKPAPIIAVDEPSKGLRIQGWAVKKPSISDGFWSTSTCDLENSAVQSQRSVSSISVTNANLGTGIGGINNNSEFVNHGLLLWQQSRLQWNGNNTSRNPTQHRWERKLSWNATYEGLLGTRNPFPRPIPLSEMVDFLVDCGCMGTRSNRIV